MRQIEPDKLTTPSASTSGVAVASFAKAASEISALVLGTDGHRVQCEDPDRPDIAASDALLEALQHVADFIDFRRSLSQPNTQAHETTDDHLNTVEKLQESMNRLEHANTALSSNNANQHSRREDIRWALVRALNRAESGEFEEAIQNYEYALDQTIELRHSI